MRRSGFKARVYVPGMPVSTLARTSFARKAALGASPMPLSSLAGKPLRRTRMRRRPTRIKEGYEPKYRRFVRGLDCAVCGRRGPSQFCHERRKGTGLALKSRDARGFPGCELHHTDYDQHRGYFLDWSSERRVAWVTSVTVPIRAGYLQLYGSEPELRQSISRGRAA
jgi:hypothetical protein